MRVAMYRRVSSEEQAKNGESLSNQKARIQAWCEEKGHTIIGDYCDEGISARKRYTRRPAILHLLEDAKSGKFDLIVFQKLDRWFRNVSDYYEVQRVLDENDIAWACTDEDYETSTASGRFKVNIMLSVAQDEADRTSERIKSVFGFMRSQGKPVGMLPFGYCRDKDGFAIVDPINGPIARKVFDLYLEYGSSLLCVDYLRSIGIKRTSTAILIMLHNYAYTGTIEGIAVEPIITKHEYNHIQRIISRFAKTGNRRKYPYVFSGLLTCGNCGARLSGNCTHPKSQNPIFGYRCEEHTKRRSDCPGCYINEKKLETFLLQELIPSLNRHIAQVELKRAEAKQSEKAIKRQINRLEQKLARLKELYLDGDLSKDEYVGRKTAVEAELGELYSSVLSSQPSPRILLDNLPDDWKAIYSNLSKERKRAFWMKIIKNITIYTDGRVPEITFLL